MDKIYVRLYVPMLEKIYDVENYHRFNSWMKIFCI